VKAWRQVKAWRLELFIGGESGRIRGGGGQRRDRTDEISFQIIRYTVPARHRDRVQFQKQFYS
jgi:hypothetical protein